MGFVGVVNVEGLELIKAVCSSVLVYGETVKPGKVWLSVRMLLAPNTSRKRRLSFTPKYST